MWTTTDGIFFEFDYQAACFVGCSDYIADMQQVSDGRRSFDPPSETIGSDQDVTLFFRHRPLLGVVSQAVESSKISVH